MINPNVATLFGSNPIADTENNETIVYAAVGSDLGKSFGYGDGDGEGVGYSNGPNYGSGYDYSPCYGHGYGHGYDYGDNDI